MLRDPVLHPLATSLPKDGLNGSCLTYLGPFCEEGDLGGRCGIEGYQDVYGSRAAVGIKIRWSFKFGEACLVPIINMTYGIWGSRMGSP